MSRFTAEKLAICAENNIPLQYLQMGNVRAQAIVDDEQKRLLIRMDSSILAMPTKRITVKRQWPRDWWQSFRERWFPAWWLRKHPIQYDSINIDEQQYGPLCPHLISDPQKSHLHFLSGEVAPYVH